MNNPFITIEDWLKRIEANQQRILQRLDQPQHQGPELGNIELACEILRLSKPRVYALVSSRSIPVMKRGGRLTFSRSELIEYLKGGSRVVAAGKEVRNGR
ncbi:helix-turn-helix domain-containing protein [Hymenobacter sp. BT188]|uniref:helix-turn-helix domain-containing protein n=1 Tax=Hymenobacter sp. BT188 TaxID=2763504 RepID=UPI001650DEB1|nr:helix-turn-helix domain-containing protein [Hymenobacter sp. BT188]